MPSRTTAKSSTSTRTMTMLTSSSPRFMLPRRSSMKPKGRSSKPLSSMCLTSGIWKCSPPFEKYFGIDENVVMEKKNLYLRLNKFNEAVNEIHKLTEAFPGEVDYILLE